MPETPTSWSWPETVKQSAELGLMAKKLYLVLSTPVNGFAPVAAALEEHIQWQVKLEREGVMFAAGPLANDDETEWEGDGMFVYRAESRQAAIEIAENDPMHKSGARSFVVRPWLLNEGSYTVEVLYSAKSAELR
jgi:uncharacterized protein